RDWTIVKLDFRVTYDTSLKQVKNVFKQINQELAADPEMGPNLLEPLKSQGVKAMEDSAMIIRAKFTAKPGQQFLIRRAVYMRVQQLFREQGIQFAHRRVAVEIPKGAENDPKALADAAAAASAAEAEGKATA
ncbi:MAG: mechanosensitive ion channel, partial [Minwuiales bacterium]|nr:mechanosensitive ion channel [Minwuiales bacterium]